MKKKLIITLTILALGLAGTLGTVIPKFINSKAAIESSTAYSTNLHDVKIKDAITIDDTETTINLGDTITVEGEKSGVQISNNIITITSSGTYNLTGTLTNGQLIINTEDKKSVKILLNGVNITSENSSPINILNGDTIFTLAENTENFISDTSNYTFEDESTNEPNAVIFSKDDLTFNGTGSLTINGNYKSAIRSKNDLTIIEGNYDITSVDDAIKGKDSVVIVDGNFNITSGGDAISSTNTEEDKGYVEIHNGNFNIASEKDGIQSESNFIIVYGNFNITTGGGSENGIKHTQDMPEEFNGNMPTQASSEMNMMSPDNTTPPNADSNNKPPEMPDSDIFRENNNNFQKPDKSFAPSGNTSNEVSTDETTSESKNALKATSLLQVEGGNFTINSADDSLHSNNDAIINGGTFDINSGNKGIHADTNVEINNGSINITKSYEGIEGSYITINDGTINITASDDGMNASDGSGTDTFMGPNETSDSSINITINGGYVNVDAAGDGLDSNGSIYINDGITIVNGPVSDGDSALDSDGKIIVNGGTLIAAGSSGMAETPDSSSTQNVISLTLSSKEAGTLVSIQDEDGKNIITFAPSKQYSSLIISSPDLESNKNYTISAGGSSNESSSNGIYNSYNGGNEIGKLTTSESVSTLSESGAFNNSDFQKGGPKGNFNNNDNSTKIMQPKK